MERFARKFLLITSLAIVFTCTTAYLEGSEDGIVRNGKGGLGHLLDRLEGRTGNGWDYGASSWRATQAPSTISPAPIFPALGVNTFRTDQFPYYQNEDPFNINYNYLYDPLFYPIPYVDYTPTEQNNLFQVPQNNQFTVYKPKTRTKLPSRSQLPKRSQNTNNIRKQSFATSAPSSFDQVPFYYYSSI